MTISNFKTFTILSACVLFISACNQDSSIRTLSEKELLASGDDAALVEIERRKYRRDTIAPVVSITSPANGATVSESVNFSASASDNVGVTRVEFYVDGAFRVSDSSSPYSYSLDTTALPNATHTLLARAFDAAGNLGNSQISVIVDNFVSQGDTTPPTVSITSPANGATISGAVNFSMNATDNVGIDRVELFVDGISLAIERFLPYEVSLDTRALSNGAHILLARAFDAANNQSSSQINVTVSNNSGDATPPTVSITSPANGATVSGSVNFSANAADNIGVARVDFYVDGMLRVSDSGSPYSYSLDTTVLSNASHTLMAQAFDAAGNQASAQISVTAANQAIAGCPSGSIQVNPGQLINSAISAATGGSTVATQTVVCVNAGSYSGGITAKSGVKVIANGYVTINGGASMTCNKCTISGFHFIRGNAWMKGDDILFEGNEINRINAGGEDYSNVFGNRITVRRNFFHGVILNDMRTGDPSDPFLHNDCVQFWNNNGETLHDIVIEENFFMDFMQGVFLANETGNLSSVSNLIVRNNVFWGNSLGASEGNYLGVPSHGVFVGKAPITGVSITNNTFWNVANNVSLYNMPTTIVQRNIMRSAGTVYAIADGTSSSSVNRGTVGNILWVYGYIGAISLGPDKEFNPLLNSLTSALGADGLPFTSDDGWRATAPGAMGYGPQI